MKKGLKLFFPLLALIVLASCQNVESSQSSSVSVLFDASKNIKIYTRDTTSGTRDGFFTGINFTEAIKDNSSLAPGYVEVAGNGEVINALKNDEYGIGYISLSSLENSTLKGLQFNGVDPLETNVINETYKLTRNFNYITRNDYAVNTKEGLIVEAFIKYIATLDGKATIKNNSGIVEIKAEDQTWNAIKVNYGVCNQDNSAVTIKFGGSTSVEKIAKALSAEFKVKCGNFIIEHNHTGSGDAFKRTQGSERDGANKLDIGFASREFKTEETHSEGTSGRICIDAIVVAVNNKNTALTNVTNVQLKEIYNGTIKTWNDLV